MAGVSFVVLNTDTKQTIFGRNVHSAINDVHEIVYTKVDDATKDDSLSHVSLEPAAQSRAIIMHKSSSSWGCDNGANDCNVVISRHLISSNNKCTEMHDALSGDAIVRLVLERAESSSNALDLITDLITKYGQKGSNSFLICDPNEVWLLETSGQQWAAERITSGWRSICNSYTITTNFEKQSSGLQNYAKTQGLWSGDDEFNFATSFNENDSIVSLVHENLDVFDVKRGFQEINMFELLRNVQLMPTQDNQTMSSSVSALRQSEDACCVHWFTGTPDPNKSVFKPFIFTPNASISKHTISASQSDANTLYQLHQSALDRKDVQLLLRTMEIDCVSELNGLVDALGTDLTELDELMKDCVETEVKFYR